MNGSPRQITNFVADRMRAAMRIDHPEECAALRMGIDEIEWLYKIAMSVYRCVGRPVRLPDGRVMELTVEGKARAYDVLASILYDDLGRTPMFAGPERTIDEMAVEDARCAETHLLERFDTPALIAMRDRRQLLRRVQELEDHMVSMHERLVGTHCLGCEPPGCPGLSAEAVCPKGDQIHSLKEPG